MDQTTTRKKTTRKKTTTKRQADSWIYRHSLGVMIAVLSLLVFVGAIFAFAFIPYSGSDGDGEWIYVPKDATTYQVKDSLKTHLGSSMGTRVYIMWKLMGGNPARSEGAYLVPNGQTALGTARRMTTGRQTPVSVTFNGTRTFTQLVDRIAGQLECSPEEFMEACLEVLPDHGFRREAFPAAFIPDTYEFYWSASPENVVKRLLDYRDKFWNEDRVNKAKALGLSKVDVATLASIVEEETAKADERPKVARLYLNRLDRGIKLQADPTVKFAVGDFALKRIRGNHLSVESPYNTYRVAGLPPGPIRIPAATTMDAVLNAPKHPYIYMCAREDFSGYHNFATDYATHQANARRYQAELNRRNIH